MANVSEIMSWTLIQETDVPSDVKDIPVEGEQVEAEYNTICDVAVVTNICFIALCKPFTFHVQVRYNYIINKAISELWNAKQLLILIKGVRVC